MKIWINVSNNFLFRSTCDVLLKDSADFVKKCPIVSNAGSSRFVMKIRAINSYCANIVNDVRFVIYISTVSVLSS